MSLDGQENKQPNILQKASNWATNSVDYEPTIERIYKPTGKPASFLQQLFERKKTEDVPSEPRPISRLENTALTGMGLATMALIAAPAIQSIKTTALHGWKQPLYNILTKQKPGLATQADVTRQNAFRERLSNLFFPSHTTVEMIKSGSSYVPKSQLIRFYSGMPMNIERGANINLAGQQYTVQSVNKNMATLVSPAGQTMVKSLTELSGMLKTPPDKPVTGVSEVGKAKVEANLIEEARKYGSAEEFTGIFEENKDWNLQNFSKEQWGEEFKGVPYPESRKVTIYRGAFLKDRQHLVPGDFVTLDKKFAKENYAGEGGKVLSKEVPVSELEISRGTSMPGKSELLWKPTSGMTKQQLTSIFNQAQQGKGEIAKTPSEKMIKMAKDSPHRESDFENDMSGNRLFHGTSKDFKDFDIGNTGKTHHSDWGKGASLTPNESLAHAYKRSAVEGTSDKGVVKEFYIDPSAKVKSFHKQSPRDVFPGLADGLKKEGYDALYIYDELGKVEEVVVMNPKVLYSPTEIKQIWNQAQQGKGEVLDSLNPTGKVFTDYNPEKRATIPLGKNITTLDKTMGKSPDETITIYRGTVGKQKEIVAGDFITTNKQLAKDYAGTGNVIEKNVKLSDILDDTTEPLGEEYIYRPAQQGKGEVEKILGGLATGVLMSKKSEANEKRIKETENSKSTDVSKKMATGVMQITPLALDDFNKRFIDKKYMIEDMKDNVKGSEVGNWYFNIRIPEMLKAKKLPNTEVNRVIAYNAGANAAKVYSLLPKETVNYLIKYYSDEINGVNINKGVNVFNRNRRDASNVQSFLKKQGYYTANIDNKWGPKSKAAFIKWIRSKK